MASDSRFHTNQTSRVCVCAVVDFFCSLPPPCCVSVCASVRWVCVSQTHGHGRNDEKKNWLREHTEVRGVVILVWLFSSLALVLVSHEQHQSGQPEQQPVLDWNCGWTIVKKQQQQQEKRVARTVEKKKKQETKISGAKFNWFLLPNSSLDDVAVVELILLLFELFFFSLHNF